MNLSLIWLIVVVSASWSGWLMAGRTEVATLLMGAAISILSGLELLMATKSKQSRLMSACGFVVGIGLFCAGAFDRLNINRITPSMDWITGFIVGMLIAGFILILLVGRSIHNQDNFKVGDIPLPHWDAIWISFGCAVWLLAYRAVIHWNELNGNNDQPWVSYLVSSLAWLCVAAVVQIVRFRKLHSSRLLIAAACPLIFFGSGHLGAGAPYIALATLSCVICYAGGSYPLRWPSGTFSDGAVLLRNWLITGLITLCMVINIDASLMNQTVTSVVAKHGIFSPLSGDAFTNLVMNDSYLWYDDIKSDRRKESGTRNLLAGRRFAERDRYSVAWENEPPTKKEKSDSNPGVYLSWRNGQRYVTHVIPGSPADKAGVTRGWRYLSEIKSEESGEGSGQFSFVDPENKNRTVTGVMAYPPLVDFRIDTRSEENIGYLYLDVFEGKAKEQLDAAFIEFRKAKVSELVVDLRNNPGGRVDVAAYFADLIAGNRHAGEVFYRLSYNAKYTDSDEVGRFKRNTNGLDIPRIFVLTSQSSCSASELMIVGLRVYLPVITIGEVTCGKPLGMDYVNYGSRSYRAINFRVSDANNQGFYNDGLVPQCNAVDDIHQNFASGTAADPMYRKALAYMDTGRCD